jgi:hypothetical protein
MPATWTLPAAVLVTVFWVASPVATAAPEAALAGSPRPEAGALLVVALPELAAVRLAPVTATELSLSVVAWPVPPPVVAWLDWALVSADWDFPALAAASPVLDVGRPVVASAGVVLVVVCPPPTAGAVPPSAPPVVVPGVGTGLPLVGLNEAVWAAAPPLACGEGAAFAPPCGSDGLAPSGAPPPAVVAVVLAGPAPVAGGDGLVLACGSDGFTPAAALPLAVLAVVLAGPAPVAGGAGLVDKLDAVGGAAPTGGGVSIAWTVVGWLTMAVGPVPDVACGPLASVFVDAVCGPVAGALDGEGEGELLAVETASAVFGPLPLGDFGDSGAPPSGVAAAGPF